MGVEPQSVGCAPGSLVTEILEEIHQNKGGHAPSCRCRTLQTLCEKLCKPQDEQKLETVCLHGSPDLNATHKSRAAPLQKPLDAELCPRLSIMASRTVNMIDRPAFVS